MTEGNVCVWLKFYIYLKDSWCCQNTPDEHNGCWCIMTNPSEHINIKAISCYKEHI